MSIPPSAVLSGLISVTSYILAPSIVTIPGIDWVQPALVWLSINMPTGSGKSSLYKYLYDLTNRLVAVLMMGQHGSLVMHPLKRWGSLCLATMDAYLGCMMNCVPFSLKSTYIGERG